MKHSILAPSSAYRWVRCPGSKHGPTSDDSSPAAEEGTRLHEVAVNHDLSTPTDGLHEGVKTFLDLLVELGGDLDREVTLESTRIPGFFGTVDAVITTEDELYVIDLKTGNVRVPAKNNYQLQCYLCLARERYPDKTQFYGIIVQNGVDAVSFSARELDKFYDRIELASTSDNRSAGEHCQYCPLIRSCDTAKEWVVSLGSSMFEDESPELSAKECKQFIALEPVAKALADIARSTIRDKILRGETVEGWRLGVPLSNRYWKDELEAAAVLVGEIGNEGAFKKTLLTPAQAEAKIGNAAVAPLTARDAKDPIAVTEDSHLKEYTPAEVLFQKGGDPESTKCEESSECEESTKPVTKKGKKCQTRNRK